MIIIITSQKTADSRGRFALRPEKRITRETPNRERRGRFHASIFRTRETYCALTPRVEQRSYGIARSYVDGKSSRDASCRGIFFPLVLRTFFFFSKVRARNRFVIRVCATTRRAASPRFYFQPEIGAR